MTAVPRNERPTWDVDDSRSIHNADRIVELFDGHDAATEHHSPEESVHLLRAELAACRAEIVRLRAVPADVRRLVENGNPTAGFLFGWRDACDAITDEMRP